MASLIKILLFLKKVNIIRKKMWWCGGRYFCIFLKHAMKSYHLSYILCTEKDQAVNNHAACIL